MGIFCIDHVKTLQTNRKSYTKEPPVPIFDTEAHGSFPTFCNRVYKVAQYCNFKCHNADCTAEDTAVRDQIIIGTIHEKIRQEALKNSWDLQQLCKEGMRIESATKGMEELNNESPVNKMGKYSFRNTKKTT